MFPVVMRLKIRSRERKGISLWIPVILVWILFWVLMIVLLPALLLAALLTCGRGPGIRLLLVYPLFFSVLWNLSGLHVATQDADNEVLISFQ